MTSKNFIHKISENIVDKIVHNNFTRFSIGEYPREPVLIKRTSKGVQVQTGFEFAIDLCLLTADLLSDENPMLKGDGVVVSASKGLDKELEATGLTVKGSRGKKYTVSFELSANNFKKAVERLADYIILFKFKIDGVELKMKMSPPKPGSLAEKFVTLKTDKKYEKEILDDFLFDIDERNFKSALIDHAFLIEDVEIPKEYEDDFATARKHAKKKGKIKRVVTVDGKEIKNYEMSFVA